MTNATRHACRCGSCTPYRAARGLPCFADIAPAPAEPPPPNVFGSYQDAVDAVQAGTVSGRIRSARVSGGPRRFVVVP